MEDKTYTETLHICLSCKYQYEVTIPETGVTKQSQAAERAALQQQAVSRLEKAASNVQLRTLQRYLGALGYHLEISVIDNRTGNVAGKTSLSHA